MRGVKPGLEKNNETMKKITHKSYTKVIDLREKSIGDWIYSTAHQLNTLRLR